MSFAAPATAAPSEHVASVTPEFWPSKVQSQSAPEKISVIFNQRVFSPDLGKTAIKLYDYPVLTLNTTDFSFSLEGWGINLPSAELPALPRQICRRFVFLWGKAERRSLSPSEGESWLSILDQVDYTDFSIQRSGTRIYEGLLLRHQPFYVVEWSDGERVTIPDSIGAPLDLVDAGEMFTAEVKIGREGAILSLDNVVILGSQESVLSGRFENWPKPS